MSVSERFEWMDRALCASAPDPDVWFDRSRRAEAVRICKACPVAELCDNRATEVDAYRGVWAGQPHLRKTATNDVREYLEHEHGTEARYRQHLREGSPVCSRCLISHRHDQADRSAVRPPVRDVARDRAVRIAARKRVSA